MSLLLALLTVALPEPEPTKRGSGGTKKPEPQSTIHEVDRFSDYVRKPLIKRNGDDELMLIFMMQGG